MADVSRGVSAHRAEERREDDEEWHDGNQSQNLRKNQIARRVDTHDVEGINLLGYPHGAQFGGDVGTHLAGKNQTHDAGRELQQHDFSGGIARNPSRHPRTLDVEFHLDADDGTDEERDKKHDADGIDTQLRHLLDILFQEHAHALRARESTPHQYEIFTEGGKPFFYYHAV